MKDIKERSVRGVIVQKGHSKFDVGGIIFRWKKKRKFNVLFRGCVHCSIVKSSPRFPESPKTMQRTRMSDILLVKIRGLTDYLENVSCLINVGHRDIC